MTTVIDHAIAIPTRPANVWEMLRDISLNPNWQYDSQRVQFLTTSKTGRGTRWRNTTATNKEQVYEILAWYEGLGYEYRIVDGANFANTRGRIRLQEAPEGTIVQWTVSYEVDGFLGGLRNQLGAKAQIDKEVVEGLRNLYAIIKDSKMDERLVPEESKAYLKEAPSVEERATYQPRHPSNLKAQEIQPIAEDNSESRFKPPSMSIIPEPALVEDDTRPNPTVQPELPKADESLRAPKPLPSKLDEPDFLRHMPDAVQKSAPTPLPTIEEKQTFPEEETASAPLPSHLQAETKPYQATELPQQPKEVLNTAPEIAKPEPLESLNLPDNKMDTSEISVFELFGLQKPSETEKVHTIKSSSEPNLAPPSLPEITPSPIEGKPVEISSIEEKEAEAKFMEAMPTVADIEPEHSRRRGLRASLRQKLAPVRLPKIET